MKKTLITCLVAASAIAGAATSASAQGVYFGFGGGENEHHGDRDRHERHDRDGGEFRHHDYHGYRPAYGGDCYIRTSRHYHRYSGEWVVRRVRVCN